MAKVTAKLDAAQAQAKFPDVKGLAHIRGAKLFGDHVALLDMGRGGQGRHGQRQVGLLLPFREVRHGAG